MNTDKKVTSMAEKMKTSDMPTIEQLIQASGGWIDRPTHEVFGWDENPFKGKTLSTIRVPKNPSALPFVPKRNDSIRLDPNDVRRILTARALRRPIMLNGPKGTGKTELFEQFYAAMGMPCITVQCGPGVDTDYLFGRPDLDDGNVTWVDGFATLARRLGAGLLLDEMDGLRSSLSPELNGFVALEKSFTLSGQGFKHGTKAKDLVIEPNPHFFLGATTNTGGKVDGGMDYVGRNPIDQSTLDRFYHFDKGYMEEEAEVEVMMGHCPGIPGSLIKSMVQFANDVRKAHKNEEVFEPVSMRQLIKWGKWWEVTDECEEGFFAGCVAQMRDHDRQFALSTYESYFRKIQAD